jgi:hypothetical protein
MCGWGITGTARARRGRYFQAICFIAGNALVTSTAISARLRREHFHGNVRMGHNHPAIAAQLRYIHQLW